MTRKIKTNLILIFFVLEIIVVTAIGIYCLYNVEEIINIVSNQNADNVVNDISEKRQNIYIVTIALITLISIITAVIGIIVSKITKEPVKKLIDSAKKIAYGEDIDLSIIKDGKKDKDFAEALTIMTNELKENLNEVSRQKNQMETILLHMTDGIIAFNMEGKVIIVNPAANNLLKITQADDTFEKIFNKIHLDVNMEKIIYLENWTSSEQRVQVNDKYVNMFFEPFKDENDRPSGIMVVIQDITEHVKLDNMRREFVADVSHELKTPITSIMGYSDTLLESEYDKEMQDKFLNVISTEARRMAKLVTDLLSLSRFDTNEEKIEKIEFDLGELVKRCQEKVQIEITKKKHKVECFVTADVPPVYADKDGIERVVLNILTNSIKYTPEEGNIKIYVGFVYNDAYIKIIDDGIGIPEEDLSRIFDRFYRVDKARTREMGGTGLGLSIAKEILDKNNGSIDIKSEVGKGTEVVIKIPTKQNK